MNDYLYYKCDKCGAKFISFKEVPRCVFCHEEVSMNDYSNDYTSFYFGTFQKTIEDARKSYKRECRNPLIPLSFRNKEVLQNICQCYVPSYFFNININGKVNYNCMNKKKNQKYQTAMKVNIDYQNEFISGNNKIASSLLNRVANIFQYELFDYQYLDNGVILDLDLEEDRAKEILHKELIDNTMTKTKEKIPHPFKKAVSQNLEVQDISSKLVYIPIYYTKVNYQGTDYYFIMNGETGDTYFKKVIGKTNIILFSIILFVVLYLLTLLIIRLF